MRLHAPVIAGGLAVLALGIALLTARAEENAAKPTVMKTAEMIEKGEDAKKMMEEIKKLDLLEAMSLLKLRTREGLGVGPAGAFPPNEDGIEAKIIGLAKREMKPADLKKHAADLKKAAYISAALTYVSEANTPTRKVGDKDPKDWTKFTEEMKKGSMDLATAIEKGDPAEVKKVAAKLNSSCNNCHGIFRE
jgi:cytochrome c556